MDESLLRRADPREGIPGTERNDGTIGLQLLEYEARRLRVASELLHDYFKPPVLLAMKKPMPLCVSLGLTTTLSPCQLIESKEMEQ